MKSSSEYGKKKLKWLTESIILIIEKNIDFCLFKRRYLYVSSCVVH